MEKTKALEERMVANHGRTPDSATDGYTDEKTSQRGA